ncbi:Mu transposase C-terminal domain-containing protein [Kitasatospora sp. NPDC017646]|uniref:Mu transposase C-terminal domain-containing protein n=1 Tax=Kitasatospora sp. NPDC017646 TaxID=3364024 RepID=UPI0037A48F31
MSVHRIAVADWISFEDERHQVARVDGATVQLRSETGRIQTIMLSILLVDPSFRQDVDPPAPCAGSDTGDVDPDGVLAALDPAVRQSALDLEGHLLELATGYRSGDSLRAGKGEPREQFRPERPLVEREAAKAAELGLTARRIRQLRRAYREEGLWALVDKRKARISNPLRNVDPRVVQAIQEQAAAEKSDSSATIGGRFYRRTQNRLDEAYGPGTVPMPSRDVFRRAVDLLVRHSPAGPALRRQQAGNQPNRPFGNVIATRPGEVVMLDTTPLDVMAFDPGTGTTMRVELTIALDVATRSILAWRLTPEGTKGIDIGLLLSDVMTPEPMRSGWEDALRYRALMVPFERKVGLDERLAEAAARPVVYPETLLYDHGKPYKSEVLRRACVRWGISLQDARKLTPTDKPQVERLFGRIRSQFSEHTAGYKGSNVIERGLTVDEQARWTIDDLDEFFAEYVIGVYQRDHHAGLHLHGFPALRMSPNEAYRSAIRAAGLVACPRDPNMYYELLPIEGRTIQPGGVQLNYLTYNAPVLYQYRNATAPYPDGLWPIRYDPRNVSQAFFLDPADGRWHVLRWTHALSEHQPFTDITLREARRLVAARGHGADDQDQIAAALVDLQNRLDAPETWRTDRKRSFRDRTRAAAQATDQNRFRPAVDDHPPLTVIQGHGKSDQDDEGAWDIDPTTIKAAEIWQPGER